MNIKDNVWVIIPAAGVGRRMGADIPKQYLLLNNKPVIEHTLNIFDQCDSVSEVIVAVSEDDSYWLSINRTLSKPVHQVPGGKERSDSVLSGLKYLENKAKPNDWVLVHDAARPCLRQADLSLLLESLQDHAVGGILATRVRDTMKRTDSDKVITETVERDNLWHALTPQMFRYGLLTQSIESALNKNELITDEASAIELAGFNPVIVEGHADNLKITRPEDLRLAAFFLKQQEE